MTDPCSAHPLSALLSSVTPDTYSEGSSHLGEVAPFVAGYQRQINKAQRSPRPGKGCCSDPWRGHGGAHHQRGTVGS